MGVLSNFKNVYEERRACLDWKNVIKLSPDSFFCSKQREKVRFREILNCRDWLSPAPPPVEAMGMVFRLGGRVGWEGGCFGFFRLRDLASCCSSALCFLRSNWELRRMLLGVLPIVPCCARTGGCRGVSWGPSLPLNAVSAVVLSQT